MSNQISEQLAAWAAGAFTVATEPPEIAWPKIAVKLGQLCNRTFDWKDLQVAALAWMIQNVDPEVIERKRWL